LFGRLRSTDCRTRSFRGLSIKDWINSNAERQSYKGQKSHHWHPLARFIRRRNFRIGAMNQAHCASFWSAPAERSDDGAFVQSEAIVGYRRRCRATLAAALQNLAEQESFNLY
jgi:hypothetical protein